MKKSLRGFEKTVLSFAALVFAILLLVSCGTNNGASTSSFPVSTSLSFVPPSSSVWEYSEPPHEVESVVLEEGQEIYIVFADGEYVGGIPEFNPAVEYVQNKDGFYVLIWSNKDLAKMSFLDWAHYDEATMELIPGEELFATEKLPAYTPLKVKIMPYGDLSCFGIRVTSLDGTEKVYFIGLSGKEYSIVLWDGK